MRRRFVTLLLIAGLRLPCAASDAPPLELAPDKPAERQIAGDENHPYRIKLEAGQYARIIADQRGIDIQLAAFGPDGKQLVLIDSVSSTTGIEAVSILAEARGTYRVEVSPVNKDAVRGGYQVRLAELRAAQPQDKTRIEGQKAFAEGYRFASEESAQSYELSLDRFGRALAIWQSLDDRWYQAATLNEIALIDYVTGKMQPALDAARRALDVWRDLGDARGQATSLRDLGDVYADTGDKLLALEYYERAVPLTLAAGEKAAEATMLNNIASIYAELGQPRSALSYYLQALAIKQAIGVQRSEAYTLYNIGSTYYSLGENQKALEQLTEALRILQRVDDKRASAAALGELGLVHARLGDLNRALEDETQALTLSRGSGDKLQQSTMLQRIANVKRLEGQPRDALNMLDEALAITQASRLKQSEAYVRKEMGAVYADLGDKAKALSFYGQAFELYADMGFIGGEIDVLLEEGPIYAETGNTAEALRSLNDALAMSRKVGDKAAEAAALFKRAHIARDLSDFAAARNDVEAALPIIESTRTELSSNELRASYLGSHREYYELYIDVLMRMHDSEAAFAASERARARNLLETLVEAHADIREGADPALLDRERALQEEIDSKEQYRLQLLSQKEAGRQSAAVEKELNGLIADYEDVEARIRAASPHYAALTQPQPLKLQEIQRKILDPETLLLEYSLGEDRSYLWVVSCSSIQAFELPKREEIEQRARRAYELLKSSGKREYQGQARLALAGLSDLILGPAVSLLGAQRLLIAGDGALQFIPFAALPVSGRPLIAAHEIVNLPSASIVGVLRLETARRALPDKTVAILSDPVFNKDDPRVNAGRPSGAFALPQDLTRSASQSGLIHFDRLPFSRTEAEFIARLAAPGEALKAVDFAASKKTATDSTTGQFRILHFATHSLLNSQHPELSGVVLSLVDEQGHPQDGFLHMHEIYNLKLNADLVVLSACETALGKEVRGEGLLGLTRGFMYAGAPRVVASLWNVRDVSTAELMSRFYGRMLKDHLAPSAALRAAQLSMLQDERWKNPYYWAAFIIQGDWRPAQP